MERLSGGSLLVRDAAAGVKENRVSDPVNARILELASRITEGAYPPDELILVAEAEANEHVILEGHTRATAYAIAKPQVEIAAIVGYAPSLQGWLFL
jgi:hypothetical protein